MKLIKATSEDNHRLSEYLKHTLFPMSVDLCLHRDNDFFAPYRLQSDDFSTYYLVDDHGNPQGMATLIFKQGWVGGKGPQTIGYLTDLRVSSQKKVALQWYQQFSSTLKVVCEERNCQSIFSVVPRHHLRAYNAFISPRPNKRQFPRYYLVRHLQFIVVHGVVPFAPAPLKGITLRSAIQGDRNALVDYMAGHRVNRPITFASTKNDVGDLIQRWKNLSIEDFIVAFDAKGDIVGCTAPWRPSDIQKYYVRAYSSKAKTLRTVFNFFSYLGVTHSLPPSGSFFNPVYLTHLCANNSDIFYSLVYYVFKRISKIEFLAYYHFQGYLTTLPPHFLIYSSIPCGLYCVVPWDIQVPDFVRPRPFEAPPDFEAAFF